MFTMFAREERAFENTKRRERFDSYDRDDNRKGGDRFERRDGGKSYDRRDRDNNGRFDRRDSGNRSSYADRQSTYDRQVNAKSIKKPLIETVSLEEVEDKITLAELRPEISQRLQKAGVTVLLPV